MNRRSFLMKLGAGMLGALVVRPSININELFSIDGQFYEVNSTHLFVSNPTGKSHNWIKRMYYNYPKYNGIITNIQIPKGF